MAYQINTKIEGTIGSTIFYKWRGDYLFRSKGNTGRQAIQAKQQAGIMGRASALSARLRKSFKPLLPGPTNRALMYRLNNILQQWLRSGQPSITEQINEIPSLKGFSFSGDDFYVVMPISRTRDGHLLLHIPAFDSPNPIHPLPFSGQISLHIMAASCNLDDAADNRSYETILDIFYNGTPIPAQDLLIPLQTMPGCITLVALSVNKMSTGVVGAMYN